MRRQAHPSSKRSTILRALAAVCVLFLALHRPLPAYETGASDGLTAVSLQLQWHHQFQFAGYYAAAEKGYYAEQGLLVEIRAGGYDAQGKAVRPVEEVVFERADFGSTRADLLIHHGLGLPVVVIADIMQHSPLVFMTLADYGFDRLEDIGGRPISLNLPEKSKSKRIDVETVAQLAPEDNECDDLFRRCDKALYAAKQRGRDRIVIEKLDRINRVYRII